MPLLAVIPDGRVLDPVETKPTRCERTYDDIKAQILKDLLPSQRAFVEDRDTRLLGLCAGFGSGKTHALCAKAVMQALDNPNTVAAVFEPTHIMIRDVWCRSFDDYLEALQLDFEYRVTPQPEYRLHVPGGICTLLCRATETWGRIRGQNLSFCLADEIDTSPEEIAQKAAEMMLARLRGGAKPQLAVASTPEGYRWLYRTFVENGDQPDRRLIKARTRDNPHLPPGFVESLQANYPPQLIASYLDGEFTNLANSTVYYPFDRDLHWCDTELEEGDRIFCSVDFNVDACFCELIVRRGEEFHVVREHIAKDTPALVAMLRETYESYAETGNLVIVPDASSRKRATSSSSESDLAILRRAGFPVKVQPKNPEIADRVNCVNVLLLANKLRIHNRCRYLIKALEQQAYDNDGKPQKGRGGKDDISGPIDALGYGCHYLAPLRRYASGQSAFYTY